MDIVNNTEAVYEPLGKRTNGKDKMNPSLFLKQVKSEMAKVTWPSRKETTQSVIAVFIMVTLAAIFLFLADQLWAWVISLILDLG